jgi:ubiquinone/menaquinone biosynthesis C-methylase UbiE
LKKPIDSPDFWRERLMVAEQRGHLHHSVFLCPPEQWQRIGAAHEKLLASHVKDTDSVLDCGCGYGHLLTLMPRSWNGEYVGLDLSPEMVEKAKRLHKGRADSFYVCDLRDLSFLAGRRFMFAVLKSIRPMVKREMGDEAWEKMEAEIRRVAKKLLFLEYSVEEPGSVE